MPTSKYAAVGCLLLSFGLSEGQCLATEILEDLKIVNPNSTRNANFGWSVNLFGDRFLVSEVMNKGNDETGSIFLYDRVSGFQVGSLKRKGFGFNDLFGITTAIEDEVVYVGVPNIDNASFDRGGLVYVFDAKTGQELGPLSPDTPNTWAEFGTAVDVDDGLLAVGARLDSCTIQQEGSVFVFDTKTRNQLAKLSADEPELFAHFGENLAIDNGIVVVGATGSSVNGPSSGSAYVFDAITGDQLFHLVPEDGGALDNFGCSVDIEGDLIAVGADLSTGSRLRSGAVYLYSAKTGSLLTKITPAGLSKLANFGHSVKLVNGILAIGAPGEMVDSSITGAAYLYDTSTQTMVATLIASDGVNGDRFGSTIAFDGNTVLVGATLQNSTNGPDTGAVYLFRNCGIADITDDGELDFFDISAFLDDYVDQDPAADFDHNQVWDFFDISVFLESFTEGCAFNTP